MKGTLVSSIVPFSIIVLCYGCLRLVSCSSSLLFRQVNNREPVCWFPLVLFSALCLCSCFHLCFTSVYLLVLMEFTISVDSQLCLLCIILLIIVFCHISPTPLSP